MKRAGFRTGDTVSPVISLPRGAISTITNADRLPPSVRFSPRLLARKISPQKLCDAAKAKTCFAVPKAEGWLENQAADGATGTRI